MSDAPSEAPLTDLQQAMLSYRSYFGHGVPSAIAALCASHPGPLVFEIRQAIALNRPVRAWQTHALRGGDSQERWVPAA
jgi:hypothetical protein